MLACGILIASVVGTTGAAMILIRPLIRANAVRLYNVHVVVFFIFLVSNIGGALSPLGDPPLFIGFLRGVDFFWTTQHLLAPTACAAGLVLLVFMLIDIILHRREGKFPRKSDPTPDSPLRVHGSLNMLLIALIITVILISARWRPDVSIAIGSTRLELQNVLRDVAMLLVTAASIAFTGRTHRQANGYSWGPIIEV